MLSFRASVLSPRAAVDRFHLKRAHFHLGAALRDIELDAGESDGGGGDVSTDEKHIAPDGPIATVCEEIPYRWISSPERSSEAPLAEEKVAARGLETIDAGSADVERGEKFIELGSREQNAGVIFMDVDGL